MAVQLLSSKTDFGSSLASMAEVNIQGIWLKKRTKNHARSPALVKKADLILSISHQNTLLNKLFMLQQR